MLPNRTIRLHRFFTAATLICLIVVVVAGSMVKATDSGMGCPDWPKCFGHLVPPMDANEVYWQSDKDYFEGQMVIHNGQLFEALKAGSSHDFNADQWLLYEVHDYASYNPTHTFIEYINRLATVLLGFLALGMLIFSFFQPQQKTKHRLLAVGVMILILFEAWLGRLVVDSELSPLKISIHLFAAYALIMLASYALHSAKKIDLPNTPKRVKLLFRISLLVLLVQLFLGTQLREIFDGFYKESSTHRDFWIESAGLNFLVHRSFSLVYIGLVIAGIVLSGVFKSTNQIQKRAIILLIAAIGLEIVSGVVMAYFSVPRMAQPLHVICSSILLYANLNTVLKFR